MWGNQSYHVSRKPSVDLADDARSESVGRLQHLGAGGGQPVGYSMDMKRGRSRAQGWTVKKMQRRRPDWTFTPKRPSQALEATLRERSTSVARNARRAVRSVRSNRCGLRLAVALWWPASHRLAQCHAPRPACGRSREAPVPDTSTSRGD